jgi:predicted metal-dependent hydrolase
MIWKYLNKAINSVINPDRKNYSYTIRESHKAKRVILKISVSKGLEVVIPRGYSKKRIPQIINEKKDWIERAFKKIEQERHIATQPRELPTTIFFQSINRNFEVEYLPTLENQLELFQENESLIKILGDNTNIEDCSYLLKRWLQYQGRIHLTPWLRNLSDQTELRFKQVQIRGQRSRWGSYSGRGTVSLNYNLLFLRNELVRYLIIHELCHSVHLNHSERFYSLLGEYEPGYKELRLEMRVGWNSVPWWAV